MAVPLLCCTDFGDVYTFLIEWLKRCDNDEQAAIIMQSLAYTEYPVLSLLLFYLSEDDVVLRARCKGILYQMGFKRLRPQLALLPVIPHEAVFRELFGDVAMDRLKSD